MFVQGLLEEVGKGADDGLAGERAAEAVRRRGVELVQSVRLLLFQLLLLDAGRRLAQHQLPAHLSGNPMLI